MIKIGIDARLYSQTGVGTYLRNFLYYLEKTAPDGIEFYIYLMTNDFSKVEFKKPNFIKKQANFHWHSVSEQIGFLNLLNHDNLNLMHFTYFSYPIFYQKNFIATIHDVTPLIHKTGRASIKNPVIYQIKHFFFKIVLASQIRQAKMVITPTRTVKNQLLNIYGQHLDKKIVPIHEGINYEIMEVSENQSLKNKFKDFFIYVGNFYPHKNVGRLLKAFADVHKKVRLILIGPEDYFSRRIRVLVKKLKLEKKVVFYSKVTIGDLVFFYKNALALIHPSLSEGFGLPLIEAAYFDCPIIASNSLVFKEILGKEYLSFYPKSIADITDAINYFLENRPKYDYDYIKKSFSFQTMTDETLKVYLNALSTK